MANIGIAGFGYWGPNLVRNFSGVDSCVVKKVADANNARLAMVGKSYPQIETTTNIDDLLNDPAIDGIVIALPVSLHYEVAKKALLKGKHVLVEKPLTDSTEQALQLIDLAQKMDRVLMVDHTFLYTGAVRKMKEIIDAGGIGDVQFFDSVRINLGLFQKDINVLWDLAPHDISILGYLLNEEPCSVVATGISHTPNGIENIAYMTLNFASNKIAHFNNSWTSPVKIRQILIGGTQKMIVYDDLEPTEKVKVYDTGYEFISKEEENKILVDYRVGDIYIPKLDNKEALRGVAEDFLTAIHNGSEPVANWKNGLSVVRILEAAEKSLKNKGKEVLL